MSLKLTVPNYFFHFAVAFIVTAFVVGAFAYVVLPGPVPNPGHALSIVQGYFQGDASLLQSLAKLQQGVTGNCAAGSSIRVINADGTVSCETDDVGAAGLGGSGTANYLAKWSAATTLANSVLYENAGNIGIGTSPANNEKLVVDFADSVWGLHFKRGATDLGGLHANSGILSVETGSAGKLYINGNVGIGTITPGQKLDVVGNIRGTQLCIGADCRAAWPAAGTGDITGVTAGTGLSGGGTSGDVTLSADVSYLQRRVSGTCAAGSSVRVVNADGTVSCEVDDAGSGITSISAGSGITLTPNPITGTGTISANTAVVQQRVTGTCASNQAIRVINNDGTVSCVVLPSSALCTWSAKTYSTGYGCWNGTTCSVSVPGDSCTCKSDGTWECSFHFSGHTCPQLCGS